MSDDSDTDETVERPDDLLQQIAESLDDPECTEYEPDESRYEPADSFGYE
jgi:hypothetical protein